MDTLIPFLLFAAFLFILFFFNEILPFCSCCRKIKPRFLFSYHKTISLTSNVWVCGKCCRKYNIESFDGYKRFKSAQQKARISVGPFMTSNTLRKPVTENRRFQYRNKK